MFLFYPAPDKDWLKKRNRSANEPQQPTQIQFLNEFALVSRIPGISVSIRKPNGTEIGFFDIEDVVGHSISSNVITLVTDNSTIPLAFINPLHAEAALLKLISALNGNTI
jgi:hypothetical protein